MRCSAWPAAWFRRPSPGSCWACERASCGSRRRRSGSSPWSEVWWSALMGWFVPQVLGVGYGFVGEALNGRMAFQLMALLVVMKLLAVTISYASGNAGGIFGPSLFIGAMLGGTVGTVAHHFFPAYTATPGAYALVGMGAVFAGVVRAPMTSVLMIFEMTQDYAVIVPLMIANLVSLFIASRLQHEPIYEALAVQDGIHLPSAKARQRYGQRQIFKVMHEASDWLPAEMTVRGALERVQSSGVRDVAGDRPTRRNWSDCLVQAGASNWRKTRIRRFPIWWMRWAFRTFTPTRRWIWRSNAWGRTRSKSSRS